MATLVEDPKTHKLKRQRKARTLDREKALALRAEGMTMPAIAQELGVSKSTTWRFLSMKEPDAEALKEYIEKRADIFADLQSRSVKVQRKLLDSLTDENGVLVPLTNHQKTGLLSVLSATTGTLHDKERLERGQSTANVGLIARMMGDAFDSVHKPTPMRKKGRTPI